MAKAKTDEEHVVVSFRARRSGDKWVRDEAARRGISRTALYREIMKRGVDSYQKEQPQ